MTYHFVRDAICLAACVCVAFDIFLTIDQEIQYIWRGNWSMVKGLYLFSRYFGLAAQIANCIVLLGPTPLSGPEISREMCTFWFGYLDVSVILLWAAMVSILGLRVYALYHQDPHIGVFLTCLLTTNVVVALALGIISVIKTDFDTRCEAGKTPLEVIYFLAISILSHLILWTMTQRKTTWAEQLEGQRALSIAPIIRKAAHEAGWVLLGALGVCLSVTPYAFHVRVAGHLIFVWPMALCSIFTCRFTLDMLALQVPDSETSTELSTYPERTDCS